MCPSSPHLLAYLCLLSLMFLIMSVTTLCFRIQFILFLSLTTMCHYWEYTFIECSPLQSHQHIFVSRDVVQLAECTPSLFDSVFYFLYMIMVFSHHLPEIDVSVDLLNLLSIDDQIILVDMLVTHYFIFHRCILRPTGLLMSWISWSIFCTFEV